MKKLNAFELVSIKHGIEVELEKDFRLHSAEKHETFELYTKYVEMLTNPERFHKWDIETTVSALQNLADFWCNYYLHGEEEAVADYQKKFDRRYAEAVETINRIYEERVKPEERIETVCH